VTPGRGIRIGYWWRPAALTSGRLMRAAFHALIMLSAAGLLSACEQFLASLPAQPDILTPQPAPPSDSDLFMTEITYQSLPGWKAERHSEVLPVFLKSCARLRKQPPDQAVGPKREMGRISDWVRLCDDAQVIRPGNDTEAQYFFESRFAPYAMSGHESKTGLITGYYEPELRGAWKSDQTYRFPLYALPKDLVSADLESFDDKWAGEQVAGRLEGSRYVPYYTRAEIESGQLAGQQLEILWVNDPIDSFFLHIQGSGRIILPDGSHVRLGYAGRNGRRYTAIGRELVAAGIMRLKDVNMGSLRRWLESNPVAGQAVMQKNKSFIFFRVVKGQGPLGAQGVVLTPGRSVAVDRRHVPLGVPMWLETTEPGTRPVKKIRKIVIAQDTGSAIKGPVRADYFWGHGRPAGEKAGIMKQKGKLYMFLPRKYATRP